MSKQTITIEPVEAIEAGERQCPQCEGQTWFRFTVGIGYEVLQSQLEMSCPLCWGEGETNVPAECVVCHRSTQQILVGLDDGTAVHAHHDEARAALPALQYGVIL